MPGMWHDSEYLSVRSDDVYDETGLDDLERFIADNDDTPTNQSFRRRFALNLTLPSRSRILASQSCAVLVSLFIIFSVAAVSVSLGYYTWKVRKPEIVLDKSIEAFNIPNHKAYIRFDAFILARRYNSTRGRFKRDLGHVREPGSSLHGSRSLGRLTDSLLQKTDTLRQNSLSQDELFDKLVKTGFLTREGEETEAYLKRLSGNKINVIHKRSLTENRHRYRSSTKCALGYQVFPRWKMQVIFLAQGNSDLNMFTKERLETVHHVEKKIITHPRFPDFCLKLRDDGNLDPAVKANRGCAPLNSLMTYFFPSEDNHGAVYFDGLGNNIIDIGSALTLAMNHNTFYYYVDEKINRTYHHSKLLRTEVVFGEPLQGFCVGYGTYGREEQAKLFKQFIISYIDILKGTSTETVRVLFGGNELFDYEVESTFWQDMKMALITLVAIVALMLVLTSFSVWLTACGIASILLSFPLAIFFYREVFNINALGILNGAAAFVIIGIGVDDIFVFVNIFHQSAHIKCIRQRMIHTVLTAGKATFFTSATTAAAFAANIASSIPAVYEFGLFMSLIVSSCWITVMLMMPPALYIWHCSFSVCERYCLLFLHCRQRTTITQPLDSSQEEVDIPTTTQTNDVPDADADVPLIQMETPVIADDNSDDVPLLVPDPYQEVAMESSDSLSKSDRFNIGLYLQIALTKYLARAVIKARWFIIAFFVTVFVVAVGLMTQLHPATKPPQLFHPHTNLQELLDLKANFSIIDTLKCDKCSAYFSEGKVQSTSAPKLPPAKPFTSSSVFNKSATTTTTTTTATTTAPTLPHFFSHAWTPRTTSKPPHTRNPASTAAPTRSWRQHQQTFHPQPPPSSDNNNSPTSLDMVESVSEDFNACKNRDCSNLKDRPLLQTGTVVYVVFGISTLDRSGLSAGHVISEYKGKVVFDEKFERNSRTESVLRDLCRVCKLIASNSELVRNGTAHCVPKMSGVNIERLIMNNIEECRDLPRSTATRLQKDPIRAAGGFNGTHILWLAFAFESTTMKGQSYFTAYGQYQKWEKFLDYIREEKLEGDSPLQSMFQASKFWKKVLMEVVAVSSAIYGLVLSLIICIIAIAIFTGNILLLVIIVSTIIVMICVVVAIFYIAGWEMGAVEAVSLSILVGSSVDYCVHLVEGYLLAGKHLSLQLTDQSNSSLRQRRTSLAVRHIGVAIVSSAMTTIIAAIPLTQTTIQPFSKFGDIVLINTSVSIVFTLTLCTALLSAIGPPRFTSSWTASGVALAVTTVTVGVVALVLFGVSRTVLEIPGPSGEPLFPR